MKDSQHSELLAAIFMVGSGITHGIIALILSVLCLWEVGASIYYSSRERIAARNTAHG